MRRHSMSRSHSKASFKRGASRIHRKNLMFEGGNLAMRGGIRL